MYFRMPEKGLESILALVQINNVMQGCQHLAKERHPLFRRDVKLDSSMVLPEMANEFVLYRRLPLLL